MCPAVPRTEANLEMPLFCLLGPAPRGTLPRSPGAAAGTGPIPGAPWGAGAMPDTAPRGPRTGVGLFSASVPDASRELGMVVSVRGLAGVSSGEAWKRKDGTRDCVVARGDRAEAALVGKRKELAVDSGRACMRGCVAERTPSAPAEARRPSEPAGAARS